MTTVGGAAPPTLRHEPGMGTIEVFSLSTDEPTLLAVLPDVFEEYWRQVAGDLRRVGAGRPRSDCGSPPPRLSLGDRSSGMSAVTGDEHSPVLERVA